MPAECPQVCGSECLQIHFETCCKAPMAAPNQRSLHSRGRATATRGIKGWGQGVSTTGADLDTMMGDTGVDMSYGIKIQWEANGQCTDLLLQFLSTHPADCHILFNEDHPSGSDKTKIHAVIAHHVFENDHEYHDLYSGEPAKFMQAMSNHLTYLRNKYKKSRSCFSQTGTGVDPSQPNTGANLLEQVILDFLWYKALDEI
ncbi:hypothetical protein BDR07DRAFT_1379977 [Suillus spraguei]|nr:hypothetical protein BDR07DRAFT_1379977 [Suillus spraguei]